MSNINILENQDHPVHSPENSPGVPILRTLYFFYFSAFGIVVTYLNIFYRDRGLSGTKIGLLAAILPLVSIVAAPLWGIWSDRIGQVRRLLTISSIGVIIAISGIGLVRSFSWWVLFTILFAFFDSSVLPIMDSTTLRNLGQNRNRFGRERVWGSVGFIITVWAVGLILERIGSRWFFIFHMLAIVSVLITLNWLPNHKTKIRPAIRAGISQLIIKREWVIFAASLLMIGLGNFAINGFLGIYIKDLGGNEGLIGLAAALATFTELPILFWGEIILNRFGPWKLLMAAFAATSIRLILYSVMPAAGWVIPISLLNSITFGVYWIATVAYVDKMASDEIKSSAQGMLYAVLNISRMLAALVSGYLYDLVGAANLFLIAAVFSVCAVFLFWHNKPEGVKRQTYGGAI